MTASWPPRSAREDIAAAELRLGGDLAERMRKVTTLVFDCDGVMTDGRMFYGPDGEAFKAFHAHDGLGLVLARAGGLKLALLTGRQSAAAERRCTELRFHALKLGRFDKQKALLEICAELGCKPEQVLYLGDDLIDVPALDLAGVPVCVPASGDDVRNRCCLVTRAPGGAGAVREICELVLQVQGLYGDALLKVSEKAWLPQTATVEEEGA